MSRGLGASSGVPQPREAVEDLADGVHRRGDGAGRSTSALTRYHTESGTPLGVFLGDGQGTRPGREVTETHLYRMLGLCLDPLT